MLVINMQLPQHMLLLLMNRETLGQNAIALCTITIDLIPSCRKYKCTVHHRQLYAPLAHDKNPVQAQAN